MANAKDELEREFKSCGKTTNDIAYGLVFLYSSEDVSAFEKGTSIDIIDFTYDDGYDTQELFGYIVFDDGSWLERRAYGGSEWWEYQHTPGKLLVMEAS